MKMSEVQHRVSNIIREANENFIVFYSNENVIITSSDWEEQKLKDLMNVQLSTLATTALDEVNRLSDVLEKGLNLVIGTDKYGYDIVKTDENIDELYVHCFVGRQFIENKYPKEVIEKTILVNGLGMGNLIANIIYYPCSEVPYSDADVQLSGKYLLNIESIIDNN